MFDPEEDIDYVMTGRFGNQEEVEMSLQVMKYWSNFAKTGYDTYTHNNKIQPKVNR